MAIANRKSEIINISDIADCIESGLRRRFAQLDVEQAVYGLDSLDEVALHPILADALRNAGYGVYEEERYPAARDRRRISEGERCDFVLAPEGRELVKEEAAGTLFDPPDALPLDEAFWLEVKVVAQFTPDGPNRNYSSQLLSTVRTDVSKLSRDRGILHAGLLIILFIADESVAEHDLTIWQEQCLERGLPIGAPARRSVPIPDRHGNRVCAIAVFPVTHL